MDLHVVPAGPHYIVVDHLSIGAGAVYSYSAAFTRKLHVAGRTVVKQGRLEGTDMCAEPSAISSTTKEENQDSTQVHVP
jgi:hypothetical protein